MINIPYFFDINKITEFVFGNPNDKTSEVEITESYLYNEESGKMVPNTRDVKEVKVNDYTGQNTIRYDMIKMFIDILDSIEGDGAMTVGQNITLNTMKTYGLIREINENTNE